MLCFEVWRNGEKLTTAGVSETGVLSVILNWLGHEANASSLAASSKGAIPGISCHVGGIEGINSIDWLETDQLKIGDELQIRLVSSDHCDRPIRSQTAPSGNPDWVRKNRSK